jgi:hypothetical protein
MEKRIDTPTHNNPIKNETIRVIQHGSLRFYDEDEYYDWKDKYSEPKLTK